MLQVRKTKYPSMRQIEKMTRNLKDRFGSNANIQTITQNGNTGFWITNDAGFSGWLDEWKALQTIYSEIMRRPKWTAKMLNKF